jgi:hypothetical protein
VLKHTRRPISSASLEERIGKAKSSRSLLPFPGILPTLSGKDSLYLTQFSSQSNRSGFAVQSDLSTGFSLLPKKSDLESFGILGPDFDHMKAGTMIS